MKALCDVHLPLNLVSFFNQQGLKAIHGSTILNGWRTTDKDFCKYAEDNDFVFITKDEDFRNTHFLQNTPAKLIKINLGNISNDRLISIFQKRLPSLVEFFNLKSGYAEINKDSISVLIRQN
jgi:predicted nuclease of predicted toxin-antitoxin system